MHMSASPLYRRLSAAGSLFWSYSANNNPAMRVPTQKRQALRRRLLLTPGHVLAQDFVDARLPSAAFLPEGFEHVRVEPKRLVHLPVRLYRPATAAARQ